MRVREGNAVDALLKRVEAAEAERDEAREARDAFASTYRAVHDVLLGKDPGDDPTANAVAARIASLTTARHARASAAEASLCALREAARALIDSKFCHTGNGDPMVDAEAFESLRAALGGDEGKETKR